ncbi:MAG: hypothetical protein PHY45_05325 [Rhodocyclaceae bacterium]|nr:hypothetical protein [Rhodocyclaceae bacterium]
MDNTSLQCHGCGHLGTRECFPEHAKRGSCDSYLSWSDLWTREMAAIERAQRATYVAAGFLAVLAVVAIIVPKVVA